MNKTWEAMDPTETMYRCGGFDDNFLQKIPFKNSLKQFKTV
jgi:hypothetical protein